MVLSDQGYFPDSVANWHSTNRDLGFGELKMNYDPSLVAPKQELYANKRARWLGIETEA